VCLLVGARATAQELVPLPTPSPTTKSRFKIGPLGVTPTIDISTGMDTNVFQTLDGTIPDEVLVIRPALTGQMTVSRTLSLTGLGYAEMNYFHREGEQQYTDFAGEGRADLDLGIVGLFGGGGGGQFTDRFAIDVDDRLERQQEHGYAGAIFHLGHNLSVSAQGSGEIWDFSPGVFRLGGNVKAALDRNTLTGTGQIRYTLTHRTTIVAQAEVIQDRFVSAPILPARVTNSYRYLGGFEFGEKAIVQGQILAGVRDLLGSTGNPSYLGPAAAADLQAPVGQALRVHFIGGRDVLYAAGPAIVLGNLRYRDAFVYSHYLGEGFVAIPLGFTGIGTFGFEQASYLLPYTAPGAGLANRLDHRWTTGARVLHGIGVYVKAGGFVYWSRRVSSIASYSYEDLRYGALVEITP
jgi:hypothetical protein